MKLHTAVLVITFLGLFSICMNSCFLSVSRLEKKRKEVFAAYNSKRFIVQSFRNTCKGRGFKNLEQWKQSCKVMFRLQEIEWQQIKKDENSQVWFYAFWTGPEEQNAIKGQVYCHTGSED